MEFHYELKIPKDRIAVLIGPKGATRKKIEKKLNLRLQIDSQEGEVKLSGEDSLNLLSAQNIVKAIGRGINPEKALDLLEENVVLESIDITDYSGTSKKRLITLRGRLIGTEGKSRKYIEQLTGIYISVYGKTITLLGEYEEVSLARKAIEALLSGSRHSTVYAWLEKQTKELKVRLY
ncbi:MAG: KH domain-containing protein [Candidatus Nanoarchaeia archaeon]